MMNRLCKRRLLRAEILLRWALKDLEELSGGMEVCAAIRAYLGRI